MYIDTIACKKYDSKWMNGDLMGGGGGSHQARRRQEEYFE